MKQHRNPINGVFFDWDRTLAFHGKPENSLADRLTLMFQNVGLPCSQAEIEEALRQYDKDVEAGNVKRLENPQTRRKIATLYRYLLNYLGYDWNWDLLMQLYGIYALLPTTMYEDSRIVVQEVLNKGYTVGIISNHSRSARPIIEELIGDLIPSRHIILSEEEGVHKPAKTIYRRAAQRIRVPAEQCLLVGDNLQVDAVGAVQKGHYAHGVWLDRQQGCGKEMPPHVTCIPSLIKLTDLLS